MMVMCGEVDWLGLLLLYVNFLWVDELFVFDDYWLMCIDVQFYWYNCGYVDFDVFFVVFNYKKCKNICYECVQVVCSGLQIEMCGGVSLSCDEWCCVYVLYESIFDVKGNYVVFICVFFLMFGDVLGDVV